MRPAATPRSASGVPSRRLLPFLRRTLPALVLLGLAPGLRAEDPFSVFATGGGNTVNLGTSSFPDLLTLVLKSQGAFTPFQNVSAFTADITFMGVPGAVTADSMNYGTSVTIHIKNVTSDAGILFTGATRADVEQKIKDWFMKDGNAIVGKFLASIAKNSPTAVTDGNPGATTNKMANSALGTFGFTPTNELAFTTPVAEASVSGSAASDAKPRYSGIGLGLNSGHFEAKGMKGSVSQFEMPFSKSLGDRVSIAGSIPIDYLDLGGGKVYGMGLNLGVPVRIQTMKESNPWGWRITPTLGVSARGSKDLAGGGVIWSGGLTNSVDYRVKPGLIVCMINQLCIYNSVAITRGDYKFDPQVDQQIVKNGFRVAGMPAKRLMLEAFVIRTDFLKDAYVKDFMTYGGAVTWVLPRRFNLALGANFDNGKDFKSWSVGLSSAWHF